MCLGQLGRIDGWVVMRVGVGTCTSDGEGSLNMNCSGIDVAGERTGSVSLVVVLASEPDPGQQLAAMAVGEVILLEVQAVVRLRAPRDTKDPAVLGQLVLPKFHA